MLNNVEQMSVCENLVFRYNIINLFNHGVLIYITQYVSYYTFVSKSRVVVMGDII